MITVPPPTRNPLRMAFHEFDIVGLLLSGAGVSLVLVPITLAKGLAAKWTADNIAMICIGFGLIICFVIWYAYHISRCHLAYAELQSDPGPFHEVDTPSSCPSRRSPSCHGASCGTSAPWRSVSCRCSTSCRMPALQPTSRATCKLRSACEQLSTVRAVRVMC